MNIGGLQSEGEKVWDRTSMGKSIRYFKESSMQPLLKSCKDSIHVAKRMARAGTDGTMEASYNPKIQQSKNSLGW
ncbi:hypothetical protein L1987_49256 [Smallanthus sonchifolius]|uniref:Uncharacterized protein n=1 Tax=Smallanthus sonchifolius TaxID=185202 RepID=A0ACB9FUQ6_9ASTR|nr:hypothetical protein L1987_49256 [Smallanthus sonchifolius]